MIGVLLCGSLETRLEKELQQLDPDDELSALGGLPRALLPINGVTILDRWLTILREKQCVTQIFLVSNGLKYKFFERWATGKGLPVEHVVNNGCTSSASSLGAVNDLRLGIERAKFLGHVNTSDVMVIGADHIFHCGFSLDGFLRFYDSRRMQHPNQSFCFCYKVKSEDTSNLGIIRAEMSAQNAVKFWEKPTAKLLAQGAEFQDQDAVTACPCFYILRTTALPLISAFLEYFHREKSGRPSMGELMEYLINPCVASEAAFTGDQSMGASSADEDVDGGVDDEGGSGRALSGRKRNTSRHGFFVMRLPSGFKLIGGSIGLAEFRELSATFAAWEGCDDSIPHTLGVPARDRVEVIKVKSFARVGLLGNPSDGFNGRTIATTVSNYFAEITIFESKELNLVPHPLYDPHTFSSLGALFEIGHREGYQGGLRLLMATCKKFFGFCYEQGVSLPKRNFTVKYDTNIPRQVGLAGSSAIVSAVVKALMEFFRLDDSDIKQALQPDLILRVEVDELHINAGLQDRVVQVYGGVVCMDFDEAVMKRNGGHGDYERLPVDLDTLPPLWLAFVADPSDSGRMHSNVRQRWLDRDQTVVEGMRKFAQYTAEGKLALLAGNYKRFMELMNMNFNLRKDLYGSGALGKANLEMIQIARDAGSACKFPGSGGAIVGMCEEAIMGKLRQNFESRGFVFVRLDPFAPTHEDRVTREYVRASAMDNAHFMGHKKTPSRSLRVSPLKSL